MDTEQIKKILEEKIRVTKILVEDDSAKHKRHKQSQGKGGHYKLLIVSDEFDGMSLVARHRLIYEILQMQQSSQIHALAISAWTSAEWKEKSVNPG